jgi:hypothetical protein
MSFIYKNPLTSTQLTNQESVARNKVFGTNFSVLQTGGYMEVYTVNDLIYTVPSGTTGLIQYSGNSIPINYSVRNLPFLPDTVSLNSDGISSGRRRLGMLVFVHETQLTYQYTIPNFEELWDAASGSTSETTYGYSVTTQSAGGADFIDAWLDSSIEGVSGVTRENARWKVFYGTDITVTGGTYNSGNGTLTMSNTTGGTFNITGFTSGGGSDTAISAITYNGDWGIDKFLTDGTSGTTTLPFITGGTSVAGELNLNMADGLGTVTITLPETSDIYVTGATFTEATGILTLLRNDGNTVGTGGWSYVKTITESGNNFTVTLNDGSQSLLSVDAITALGYDGDWGLSGSSTGVPFSSIELPFVTAGTYNNGTLTLNLNGSSESDITISGFDSDDTYLTGATYTPTTLTLGMSDDTEFNVTGFAPEITGGTYSAGTISLLDNTGGQVNITGISQADISIYNSDGELTGRRVVDQSGNDLVFSGGSVSMGRNTTSPTCALLELASESQGLLIPRMTQEQRLAIDTPLPGLLVYCTNTDASGQEGMFMYKSNGWVNVL